MFYHFNVCLTALNLSIGYNIPQVCLSVNWLNRLNSQLLTSSQHITYYISYYGFYRMKRPFEGSIEAETFHPLSIWYRKVMERDMHKSSMTTSCSDEKLEDVAEKAEQNTEERMLDLLLPPLPAVSKGAEADEEGGNKNS